MGDFMGCGGIVVDLRSGKGGVLGFIVLIIKKKEKGFGEMNGNGRDEKGFGEMNGNGRDEEGGVKIDGNGRGEERGRGKMVGVLRRLRAKWEMGIISGREYRKEVARELGEMLEGGGISRAEYLRMSFRNLDDIRKAAGISKEEYREDEAWQRKRAWEREWVWERVDDEELRKLKEKRDGGEIGGKEYHEEELRKLKLSLDGGKIRGVDYYKAAGGKLIEMLDAGEIGKEEWTDENYEAYTEWQEAEARERDEKESGSREKPLTSEEAMESAMAAVMVEDTSLWEEEWLSWREELLIRKEREEEIGKMVKELEGKSIEEIIDWYVGLLGKPISKFVGEGCRERARKIITAERMSRHEYRWRGEEKWGWSRVEIVDGSWAYVNGEGEYLNGGETFLRAGDFEEGKALVTLYEERCRFSGEEWQWNNLIDAEGRLMFPQRWGNSLEIMVQGVPMERRLYYYGKYMTGPGFGIRRSKENERNVFRSDINLEVESYGTYIVRSDGSYVFDIPLKLHGVFEKRTAPEREESETGYIEDVTKKKVTIRVGCKYHIYYIESGERREKPIYKKEKRLKGSIYIVSWKMKYGIYDVKDGRCYLPIEYESIEALPNGNYMVSNGDSIRWRKYGVVDIHGKTIVEVKYSKIEVVEREDGRGGKTWRYRVWTEGRVREIKGRNIKII